MTKKVEFEAFVRNAPSAFANGHKYGRIASSKLGDFIGKKVRITVEELPEKA